MTGAICEISLFISGLFYIMHAKATKHQHLHCPATVLSWHTLVNKTPDYVNTTLTTSPSY
jgi:hypothetical protein